MNITITTATAALVKGHTDSPVGLWLAARERPSTWWTADSGVINIYYGTTVISVSKLSGRFFIASDLTKMVLPSVIYDAMLVAERASVEELFA